MPPRENFAVTKCLERSVNSFSTMLNLDKEGKFRIGDSLSKDGLLGERWPLMCQFVVINR